MQSIVFRKHGIRIAEIWFHSKQQRIKADIVRYLNVRSLPTASAYQKFHSLAIDLTENDECLLKAMDSGTRYEIRRAQAKDALHYRRLSVTDPAVLRQFVSAYDTYIREKSGLAIGISRLKLLAKNEMLDLTVTERPDGNIITWHMYIVGDGVARLLHSISTMAGATDQESRNLCGRANRLHHWLDIRHMRERGHQQYDFGGYYMGKTDGKKLQINKFKRGFGGKLILSYNGMCPLTLAGQLAYTGWKFFNKG